MSGNKLIVDTNIVLYFLKGNPDIIWFFADYFIGISFITELELLSLSTISPDDEQTIQAFSRVDDPRIILYEL